MTGQIRSQGPAVGLTSATVHSSLLSPCARLGFERRSVVRLMCVGGPSSGPMGLQVESEGVKEVVVYKYEALLRTSAAVSNLPGYRDSRLERNSPWNPANLLFTTDYDNTCTVEDSCQLLVWAKEHSVDASDNTMAKAYDDLWEEYEKMIKDNATSGGDVDGWEPSTSYGLATGIDPSLKLAVQGFSVARQQFGSRSMREALKRVATVEYVMNDKVMTTGFLRGLRKEAILAAGKRIDFQTHSPSVLSRLAALGTTVHVISANWSRALVYGGLSFLPEERLLVHSNELEIDDAGYSTGYFQNLVTNAFDKEKVQQALRKMMRTEEEKMVVYLGDAPTDLLALLDADLGIVMGQRVALRSLLDENGIQLRPLGEAAALLATSQLTSFRQSGFLFQATGWEDVEACLFGAEQELDFLPSLDMPMAHHIRVVG